ncbi:MAG: ABC transporter ATP-binding protein [Acidaminococcaceae bacterium]|nr:ABC transporter ATP-binding protein [Acidaminococcaceae bacterium]
MEKNTSICIRDVSKRYKIYPSRQARLKDWFLPFEGKRYEEKWVLRDISLDVLPGEAVGLVGMNGAGKSTLLKIVTGTTQPTTGTIEFHGSVAALLELGSGFDKELTVRENTYLRGALLGYTRSFMDQKYQEIISFAELEDFQDRPCKQLSSGMKSRLAFSIASLVNPDILILDEVLSVGDGSFKEKSRNKMLDILSSGVTGILVSHSISQVRSMCNKILWLDHGEQIVFSDEVEVCCNAYNEFLVTKQRPADFQDVQRMAKDWKIREQRKQQHDRRTETQKLEDMLNKGSRTAAIQAATNFLTACKTGNR